jgi:hypothetical protein
MIGAARQPDDGILNRREFVVGAAALLAGAVTIAAPARLSAAIPVVAVYDPRHVPTRQFAATLRACGLDPLATLPDVVSLWRHALCNRSETLLAGMTTYADFAILRASLARQRRVPVYEGFHRMDANRNRTHTLLGPAASLAIGAPACRAPNWAAALAEAFTDAPFQQACLENRDHRQLVTASSGEGAPTTLVSWVFAPRGAAAI